MSDSIQLAYRRLDLRTARQRIADLERDLAAAVADFETGLTIIKERDATIAKLREALKPFVKWVPVHLPDSYEMQGTLGFTVGDLRRAEAVLAESPESAASELAQLMAEQMQYSVLRNTLAASLEIGVPERTRAGDNSLIDAITDLRDAARAAK